MILSKNSSAMFRKVVLIVGLLFIIQLTLFAERDTLLNKKITLNAEDASVSQVLSTMAKLSDTNIVLAMDVASDPSAENKDSAKITIHVKDLPIEQALSLVVKSSGLAYKLVGDNTFLVGDLNKISTEVGERSYVIQLNYVDAEKITTALEVLPGKIKPIKGQNALVIFANPQSYAEISKRVAEIDIPQKQIEIRARLIEINLVETEKLGIDWSRLNKLTTVLAENPTTSTGYGLPQGFSDTVEPYGDGSTFGKLPDDQYWQKIDGFNNIGHFSRQLTAFEITLDFLLENNAAQMLTDTRITAMNGEEASIHIGEVVPYLSVNTENDYQVERENIGIMLNIMPTVNHDGRITALIEPTVSSVEELVGNYIPRTKVRTIKTTVTVNSGNKIIVGGLLSSSITKKTSKLPFLGSLPWIGGLFRHSYEEVRNTDLIVEITPRIVTDADLNEEFSVDPRLERSLIPKGSNEKKFDFFN